MVDYPCLKLDNHDPAPRVTEAKMGYRINPGEHVEAALVRIATEQIDKAIDELNDADLDRNALVHQVRKRCKKIRALLRLVRPGIKFYNRENKAFRNAARRLSMPRDLAVMAETYDLVMKYSADQDEDLERAVFANIRRALTLRKQSLVDSEDMGERLCKFHAEMADARQRVGGWSLHKSAGKAIENGVKRTFSRAVDAMHEAYDDPSPEKFHEWRKRAKYHWYHSRLLESLWPEVVKPYRDEIKRVSSALGDHHDLAVLSDRLRTDRELFGDGDEVWQLADLADGLRERIAADLADRAQLLFTANAKHVGRVARRIYKVGTPRKVQVRSD